MDVHVGKVIKILIGCHTKNTCAVKRNILALLRINRNEFAQIIRAAKDKLKEYELRLIGVTKGDIVPVTQAEKFFLTKYYNINEVKRRRVSDTDENRSNGGAVKSGGALPREYHAVFVIVFLESGAVTLDRLLYFVRKLHFDVNMDDVVYQMKKMHYLMFLKKEDVMMVAYDWRFTAEFPHYNPMLALENFCTNLE
ncbi:hypothetical protein VCUG_01976 [Vavraia culicis subsp. floridensis]|uniref:MAGE domain-containing protein n=1 Tax=Vavraia culicis (isolate floridensis) TaxID=948595 RepID=L2GTB8_VAVCU|nr:uncharacterized protein VCUG_01976 [Vavraia culicis subsp. floridensis]ELA46543.1 hypothetical protein VCUG_01976 [Vavraia culicis subsp. floridensis]